MGLELAVLASGSSGNASLIRAGGGPGLMIDCGLGAKDLTRRLQAAGADWDLVRAVLLTHTHGDHVNIAALARMVEHGVDLYCHPGHRRHLLRFNPFLQLEAAGLVRYYDERPFLAPCGFRVEAIELSHDGGPTFGFRVEGRAGRRGKPASVGYVADTGIWTDRMADGLAEVDVLGVEFNHDVDLQRSSGRSPWTIARNLGKFGHLSNEQGAELAAEVFRRSDSRTPKHLVLLHISGDCNRKALAVEAAKRAVRESGRRLSVHAAEQSFPFPILPVEPRRSARAARPLPKEEPRYSLLF